MVFEPDDDMNPAAGTTPDTEPPHTLSRPADPSPPLEPAAHHPHVLNFRRELAANLQTRRTRRQGSLKAAARTWVGRVSGRADRRLLLALAEATQVLVDHHDALLDRITAYETLNADLRATLSGDLVRLRAEVIHLRRLTASSEADGRG